MVDRQQTWSTSTPPNTTPPQMPWTASVQAGIPQQHPRGQPMPRPIFPHGSSRPMPISKSPGLPQPPITTGQRPPFRPAAPPQSPMRPTENSVPIPTAFQRPWPQPPNVGFVPGAQAPGHVQHLPRPFPPAGFAPPSTASHPPLPPHTFPGQSQTAPRNEVFDKFQSLTLGPPAPGSQDNVDDAQSLPRPDGLIPAPPLQTYPQNAHDSFIRMTSIYAPRSGSLLERFHFPYGAVLQPLNESSEAPPIPIVKLETYGILRCRRCRTYINPFVEWVDDGRRWICSVCTCLNETPRDFYCSLDHDGKRRDIDERPEIASGSVEYVAPPEYMVRPPMPAIYLFVVDVSAAQMSAEVVGHLSQAIRFSLDKLQGDDRKRIGFMTFDRTVQFYSLNVSDTAKMLVVPEIDDPFLPQPDDLLTEVAEGRSKIEAFLESWPANFKTNSEQNKQSAMGSALQAAFMLLSHTGGKLELFLTSPPSLGAGAVRRREAPGLHNTDREATTRNPEDSFYKRFAAECSRVHICIDLFSFAGVFTDLASIVSLSKYTGGQVYRYPGFLSKRDGGRLHHDVVRNLTRYTAWEGVMRIRCSKGLKITSFCGHFFIRSTDLLALPSIDPDKSFAVEIKHDETVLDGKEGCIQCALLYTSSMGERRIRVHTLQFPISHEIGDLYRGADAVAIAAYTTKFAMNSIYDQKLSLVNQKIEGMLISGLREYRILHSRHFRGQNKLLLPETLRWLPLWILALLKSNALRGKANEVPADERIATCFELMSSTADRIIHILSPSLYNVTEIDKISVDKGEIPPVVPCVYEFLSPNGVYLLDTSRLIFLLFGSAVDLIVLSRLTGVSTQALKTQPLHSLRVEPAQDNALSKQLCAFLNSIRARRKGYQPILLIQLGTDQEQHLWSFLIEDRRHSMRSYHDFVLMLHKQIGGK